MTHISLEGMHALVTGASSGIGEAIAIELAAAGCRVSLAARRASNLEALAERIEATGREASVFPADLARPGAARELAAEAERKVGPVDVLVNNAGTAGGISHFVEKTPDEVRSTFELNLLAPVELAHAVLPGMIARGRGALVSVASVSAFVPTPTNATYVATKRALAAIDEVLRVEAQGTGVHVLTVYPGPVETDMLRATIAADPMTAMMAKMPTGDVATIAKKTRRAIERRQDVLVYPEVYGFLRFLVPFLGEGVKQASPFLPKKSR